MKKFLRKIAPLMFVATVVTFTSCVDPLFGDADFDESDLVGTWQSHTLYETYKADSTGYTWDTSDDVTESEAQAFTWTLTSDNLIQIHIMEMGGEIPRSYTITELTSSTMVYEDSYGAVTSFERVS